MATELPDRPFLAFLSQLRDELVQQMYQSEPCCLAIYRLLPSISQQCVAMMIFNPNFNIIQQSDPDLLKSARDNVELLKRLRLIDEGNTDDLNLNIDFRFNYLNTTVKGTNKTNEIGIMQNLDDKSRKAASKDLYKKAIERWEAVLTYLALPSDRSIQNVSITTRELFQHIGFNKEVKNEFEITSLGFQYLLLGRTEQIWTYLIYYFKYVEATQSAEDLFHILEFFFRLALCVTASDISEQCFGTGESKHLATALLTDEDWSECVIKFLTHLREIGLVFMRKRKDGYFFLTPLFCSIIATDNLLAKDAVVGSSRDKGFLVTETNYRISAYTNSNLHLSILATFTNLIIRFDNFVVAHMTRETVREALKGGITARQITQFLRSNAHQKTIQTHGPLHCVPPTVIDQIHLWEEERERLSAQDCSMYSAFNSEQEYIRLRNFATEQGILLYDDQQQKIVIVTEEGHEQVRQWYQRNN